MIDAEWQSSIRTIGTVHVKQNGSVVGGTLHVLNLMVEGSIRGGEVYVCERLECRSGALVDLGFVQARDVIVQHGARAVSKKRVTYRNVEIEGELHAKLVVEGLLRVRAGGLLRGEAEGAHLEVEEGGGLKAF